MPLSIGSSVAHYQILGTLGAGGMGEVYRARDIKLGRDVALKILPDDVRRDEERRARFAREARALAALNHPNIAQIYGFEDGEPISALIMELVDGDDLSERIRRGAIPYHEAIAIARQIGEALQAAHDRGIVHRDLKPGNIKVKDDGTIKVLDFGLAKALDPSSGIGEPPRDISHSPTITTPAMTLRGMILGTAAYMSPEQAKGRVVDKRADIWAFGCVLYEMLTGRRAFAGDDVSDTLASILKSDPDWNAVPPQVTRLLKKCLEKDPRKRLHDIGDVWELIDEPRATPAKSAWLPWSIAALLAIATAAVSSMRFFAAHEVPAVVRFQILPPVKYHFDIYLALSPDGKRMAFTAVDNQGVATIWVRDLDTLEARQLPGTKGAWSPFWSPDGKFLAFGQDRFLKKIDLEGGPPQTIVEVKGAAVGLGAWNADDTILFGSRGNGAIRKVSANGGEITDVTAIDPSRQETTHAFPIFLPDGKRFLYWRGSTRPEFTGVYVASLDVAAEKQDQRLLVAATLGPIGLIAGRRGPQLLIFRDGAVLAQPFDTGRATTSGDPVTIAEHVGSSGSFGFLGSGGDTLIYRNGTATSLTNEQLTWVNRKGETIRAIGEPLAISHSALSVALSPAADQAAIMRLSTAVQPDLWTVEFSRSIATRITFSDGPDVGPVWSPDGSRLAFRSGTTRSFNIVSKNLNGTDDEAALSPSAMRGIPSDWSKDGRFLFFNRGTDGKGADLLVFDMNTKTEIALLATSFDEQDARLSPDGRMLAYQSNESGAMEIYLRPFSVDANGKPAVGAKWRVSTAGGISPKWRADGKELFYRGPAGEVMAVNVAPQPGGVQTDLPRKLFAMTSVAGWDVAPDGQRFLMSVPVTLAAEDAPPDPVTVILNWNTALAK